MQDSLEVLNLNLKQALDREKELRRNTMALHLEKVKQLQEKNKEETKLLKDLRKKAEKSHKQALNAFEKASKDLQEKRDKLTEAEIELKKVLETGQDSIKPELLVIVPAELSSYIDLREMTELSEEDIALCEFVCTSKQPLQQILRQGQEMMLAHDFLHGIPRKVMAAAAGVSVKAIEKRLAVLREKLRHPGCRCFSCLNSGLVVGIDSNQSGV